MSDMDLDDDKPFVCSAPLCGQRFTNEDHLSVHMRKHEMSLALNMGSNLAIVPGKSPVSGLMPGIVLDQTPTPTKFLKNCEEIGLFQELKNPFEEAFKKALDTEPSAEVSNCVPLPGPSSNELNTPVPPIPRTVDDVTTENTKNCDMSTRTELSSMVLARLKQEKQSPSVASSTTNDDVVIISTQKEAPAKGITPSQTVTTTKNFTLVTAAQSTTTSPPRSTEILSTTAVQPQYAMQVYLQLPNGQTVPVQIPATINPSVQLIQPNQPALNKVSQPATVIQPQATTALQHQVTMATGIQPQTIILPAQATTAQSQTTLTKQRLKAAIQSQSIPSPVSKHASINQISPVNKTAPIIIPPVVNQMSPEATTHVPGYSGSLPNLSVNATSPLSVDTGSITSDTPSSPGAADSTVNIKRAKMEDDSEDRRKKFLERNRVAAARCRQKRKHWVKSLEKKGDELQSTNNKLQSECNMLRAEVAQLKTLLLAHKDCPVTLQQKVQGQLPFSFNINDQNVNLNPTSCVESQAADQSKSTSVSKVPDVLTALSLPGTIVKTLDPSGMVVSQTPNQPATIVKTLDASGMVINQTLNQPPTINLSNTTQIFNQKTYTIIPKVIKTEGTHVTRKK